MRPPEVKIRMKNHQLLGAFLVGSLFLAFAPISRAQDDAAIAHAKKIMELSQQEKFAEIVAEFNAQMGAAINADQMKQQWAAVKVQVGNFKSFIDQQVSHPNDALTVVMLGCQFEMAALNFQAAFDKDNKIAGLRIVPRQ